MDVRELFSIYLKNGKKLSYFSSESEMSEMGIWEIGNRDIGCVEVAYVCSFGKIVMF